MPIEEAVYPAIYGGDYENATDKEAILNLIAHLVIVDSIPGSAPARLLISKSAGSVSGSYASPVVSSFSDEYFNTTRYGQRFKMITRANYGGRPV